MNELTISATNLGSYSLEEYCPRCEWIKLRCALPWQTFPGIFNSIASFTEKITHGVLDSGRKLPWMQEINNDISGWNKIPHWSKFGCTIGPMFLRGVPDDILKIPGGTIIIDYKTSKHSKKQDELFPKYRTQLNAYSAIANRIGFGPVKGLYLVYYEPQTDKEAAELNATDTGFKMEFEPTVVNVPIDAENLYLLIDQVKELYDGPIPPPTDKCKNCSAMDTIVKLM